jgi:hypothetical protein
MKFIVDRTLGKLAKWLRILGYDTLYWRANDIDAIVDRALREHRVIITKDSKLHRRASGTKMLHLREDNYFLQLKTVIRHFHLPIEETKLFSRCLSCNTVLEHVDPEEVQQEIPEYIFHVHRTFSRCRSCCKVYWEGSHRDRITGLVERLREDTA